MVSSAQLKIVLENSWTLETFEEEDAISRLRIRVQRSHLHRAGERQPTQRIDVCDDLFAEFLFAGRNASSTGVARKTGRAAR